MGGGNFKIQNSTICIIEVKKKQKKKKTKKKTLFIFLHNQLPFFLGEKWKISPGNPSFSPGNTCISPGNF